MRRAVRGAAGRTSLRRLATGGVVVGLVLLAVLLSLSLVAERSMQQATAAEARRSDSLRLAYELRQTSDDLTRMARSYVATGDARYLAWFREILAIRAGTAPRPEAYDGIYWDAVTDPARAGAPRPTPFGPPVAFATLAARTGFSPQEAGAAAARPVGTRGRPGQHGYRGRDRGRPARLRRGAHGRPDAGAGRVGGDAADP